MKKQPPCSPLSYVRFGFIALCGLALAALVIHPEAVATVGGHVHSLGASDLAAANTAVAPGVVSTSSGPASTPRTDQGSAASAAKSGNAQAAQGTNGQPITPPVDGGSAAANSRQKSLQEAASEPKGAGLHPEAPNPAPVPRGTIAPSQVLDPATQSLGGCFKEYGDAGQCLPVTPPSLAEHVAEMKAVGLDPASMPHNWSCSEVRTYFPNGLTVRVPGVDPQKLDTNRNGIACDAAD